MRAEVFRQWRVLDREPGLTPKSEHGLHGGRDPIIFALASIRFDAVDPETLKTCLDNALGRTQPLMVIAYP